MFNVYFDFNMYSEYGPNEQNLDVFWQLWNLNITLALGWKHFLHHDCSDLAEFNFSLNIGLAVVVLYFANV